MFENESARTEYYADYENKENVVIGLEKYAEAIKDTLEKCPQAESIMLAGSASQGSVRAMSKLIVDTFGERPIKLIVLDIDSKALEYSKNFQNNAEYPSVEVEFVQGDITKIPLSDNCVDFIHMDFLATCVPAEEQNAMMLEINRVLKPKGVVSSILTTISYQAQDTPRGTYEIYNPSDQITLQYRKYNNRGVSEIDLSPKFLQYLAQNAGLILSVNKLDHTYIQEENTAWWGENDLGWDTQTTGDRFIQTGMDIVHAEFIKS